MMQVVCQVCGCGYAAQGQLGLLTQMRCPRCGVAARFVQVPMGRTANGKREQPGMPEQRGQDYEDTGRS